MSVENVISETHFSAGINFTETLTVHFEGRRSWFTEHIWIYEGKSWWNNKTNLLLVSDACNLTEYLWYDTLRMFLCNLGGTDFTLDFEGIYIILSTNLYMLRWNRNLTDLVKRIAGWRLGLLEFNIMKVR